MKKDNTKYNQELKSAIKRWIKDAETWKLHSFEDVVKSLHSNRK